MHHRFTDPLACSTPTSQSSCSSEQHNNSWGGGGEVTTTCLLSILKSSQTHKRQAGFHLLARCMHMHDICKDAPARSQLAKVQVSAGRELELESGSQKSGTEEVVSQLPLPTNSPAVARGSFNPDSQVRLVLPSFYSKLNTSPRPVQKLKPRPRSFLPIKKPHFLEFHCTLILQNLPFNNNVS